MKKTKSRSKNSEHSGISLLVSFVIAALAVAYALRQLYLESKFAPHKETSTQTSSVIAGSYQVITTTTDKSNRTITLTLDSNRSATLTETINGVEPNSVKGSWSSDSNSTVIVTLGSDRVYAFSYSDNSLKLLNPDVKFWGSSTLTLTKLANY